MVIVVRIPGSTSSPRWPQGVVATFRGGVLTDCMPPDAAELLRESWARQRDGYSPADGDPEAYQASRLAKRFDARLEMYADAPKPDDAGKVY